MSLDQAQDERPISSVDELVRTFRDAERPRSEHKVGLEHEKLILTPDGAPVRYEGPSGIQALLMALEAQGLQPFREAPGLPVIALQKDALTVSLEPGGQFELSGTASLTARAAHQENLAHLSQVRAAAQSLGLKVVALGYRPFGTVEEMPWMPKTRYRAMRETLGQRGSMALDMMLMTATGQASYDWEDEADCVRKTTTAARLAPVLVALFANSPLVRGAPSGKLSYRSFVWTDVDKARCGFLPSWFDGSFSYRAYVEWALEAPILFLRRKGGYLKPAMTFRRLLAEGFEGKPALAADWVDHLSTLFPEVRLKKVVEIRSADGCSAEMTGALVALWRGLFYDPRALEDAAGILPALSFTQHLELQKVAQEQGLKGTLGKVRLVDAARALVDIAGEGLRRLDVADAPLLDPLREVAHAGSSPAERVLEQWAKKPDRAALVSAFPA
jgi:glutamate--cysteine ligase